MTKLRNMFGLFALVCALCFIPNVYAETTTCGTDSAVAQIGETCYTDLKGAIDQASSEATIEVYGTITLENEDVIEIVNKTITLNLNDATIQKVGYSFDVKTGSNLTISGNGTIENTVEHYSGSTVTIYVEDSSKLTIGKDVTVKGYDVISLYNCTGDAAFDLYGKLVSKMDSDPAYLTDGLPSLGAGIYVNKGTGAPAIHIHDGASITGEGVGLYLAGPNTTTIDKATIEGATGIAIKSGTLTLNGATVTGTYEYAEESPWTGGVKTTGSAIQIESDSKSYPTPVSIKITDGTFKSEHNVALQEYLAEGETKTSVKEIEILGGSFDGYEGSVEFSDKFIEENQNFISGGTFTSNGEKDEVEESLLDESRKEDAEGNVVPAKVTVTFHNGEKNTGSTSVENSDIPSQLTPETAGDNYQFDGWYLDENFEEKLTSDTVVSGDIDLYARFVVTVTLDYGEGKEPTEDEITKGDNFTKPTDPTKKGYVFQGWYTSSGYEEEFDFASDLNENTTIYAKFAKELGITVKGEEGTFDSLEGKTYADFKKQLADIIEKLETEAEAANKHFGGFYYEDANGKTVYVDDKTILTEDIELVPYYVVEITIGEKTFIGEETFELGQIINWSQFDNVEGKVLSHFVDEDGNQYGMNSEIKSDITLTPVYIDETEVPNTLDNVTSTAMMTIVGFVIMLVAGVLAIKSRKA